MHFIFLLAGFGGTVRVGSPVAAPKTNQCLWLRIVSIRYGVRFLLGVRLRHQQVRVSSRKGRPAFLAAASSVCKLGEANLAVLWRLAGLRSRYRNLFLALVAGRLSCDPSLHSQQCCRESSPNDARAPAAPHSSTCSRLARNRRALAGRLCGGAAPSTIKPCGGRRPWGAAPRPALLRIGNKVTNWVPAVSAAGALLEPPSWRAATGYITLATS